MILKKTKSKSNLIISQKVAAWELLFFFYLRYEMFYSVIRVMFGIISINSTILFSSWDLLFISTVCTLWCLELSELYKWIQCLWNKCSIHVNASGVCFVDKLLILYSTVTSQFLVLFRINVFYLLVIFKIQYNIDYLFSVILYFLFNI